MATHPQLSRRPSSDERFGNSPCQLIAVQVERLQAIESAEGFGKCSSKIVVGQIQPNDGRPTIVALSALYAVPATLCSLCSKPPDAMCPLWSTGRLEERDQRRTLGSGDRAVGKPSVETRRIASRIMLIDSAYETTRWRRIRVLKKFW